MMRTVPNAVHARLNKGADPNAVHASLNLTRPSAPQVNGAGTDIEADEVSERLMTLPKDAR